MPENMMVWAVFEAWPQSSHDAESCIPNVYLFKERKEATTRIKELIEESFEGLDDEEKEEKLPDLLEQIEALPEDGGIIEVDKDMIISLREYEVV